VYAQSSDPLVQKIALMVSRIDRIEHLGAPLADGPGRRSRAYASDDGVSVRTVNESRYQLVSVAVFEQLAFVAFDWRDDESRETYRYLAVLGIDRDSPAVADGCLEQLREMFDSPRWPWVDVPLVGEHRLVIAQ
jgi:hypothetical protein